MNNQDNGKIWKVRGFFFRGSIESLVILIFRWEDQALYITSGETSWRSLVPPPEVVLFSTEICIYAL